MRQSLLLLVLVVSSCAPKSSNHNPRLLNGSVINGSEVKEKDPLNASVVAVYNSKSNYICTGSLIAANIVITAAHCAPKRPSELKVIFATDVDTILHARELDVREEYALSVTDFKVHPKWDENNETQEYNTFDIAVLKFKGTLPLGYKPATFLKDESALKLGAVVTVAGYGVDSVDTNEIEPKKGYNISCLDAKFYKCSQTS
ncbi:MAG: trypsin-like serine protease, partial [Bdellovibrionales bacterium]|nr:trypsin-like serine protease [Bdellovibrionales bacterium]